MRMLRLLLAWLLLVVLPLQGLAASATPGCESGAAAHASHGAAAGPHGASAAQGQAVGDATGAAPQRAMLHACPVCALASCHATVLVTRPQQQAGDPPPTAAPVRAAWHFHSRFEPVPHPPPRG